MKNKFLRYFMLCLCTVLILLSAVACGGGSNDLGTETVKSIEVTTPPTKTEYYTNESFDTAGMVVTATHLDGTKEEIKDYRLDACESLTAECEAVHVYYGGRVAVVNISVSEIPRVDVRGARMSKDGDILAVCGYYVGITSGEEFLIKDKESDIVMEVRGCTFDYSVGDEILAVMTLEKEGSSSYLTYSADNATKEATLLSLGNELGCTFEGATKVASWQRMQSAFKTQILKENTLISLSGDFYIVKDQSGDYLIHMNSSASSLADIKPDGTRAIRIEAGTKGAEIVSARLSKTGSVGAYPGVLYTGTLNAVYAGEDGENFKLILAESSWTDIEKKEHVALREVAYAYYNRGKKIQYDQYGVRRNINPSPELATKEHRVHLDCSSFVNAVYYETFGENIQPYPTTVRAPQTGVLCDYAKENLGISPDVIGHWVYADDYSTEEGKQKVLNEILGNLETGDVLVYRRRTDTTGHALIYVGNNMFLHSSGASYQYCYEKDENGIDYLSKDPDETYDQWDGNESRAGTIAKLSLEKVFLDPESDRYILRDFVSRFCILRPMARGLTVTEKTENRLTIPGVVFEKSASVGPLSSVYHGEVILYTITITNKGDKAVTNLALTDKIPAGTEYISGSDGIYVKDGVLTWAGELEAGETVQVMYNVSVTENTPGFIIDASYAALNGVAMNPLTHTVSGIGMQDLKSLPALAQALVEAGKTYSDPILLAKELYASIGVNILDNETALSVLDKLIDLENYTSKKDSDLYSMLVKELYGGYSIRSGYKTDNTRSRLVTTKNLALGDIIVAEYLDETTGSTISRVFVYLGGRDLLRISSADGVATIEKISEDEYKNTLVTLIAYDRYAVLRPSQK
jgi:uncharacterized repeat protein (TIGR01451 family)